MIPVKSTSTTEAEPARSQLLREGRSWQRELLEAVTDVDELLRLVALDPSDIRTAVEPSADFPLRVPRPYIARMGRGDPDDPLLRQVLPTSRETEPAIGYGFDPLGEAAAAGN